MSSRRPDPRGRGRQIAATAPIFAALGDETRLGLVTRLASGDALSIARLTEDTRLTRQAVTRHLEVLAEAGLVRGSRRGREHVWRLEPARLALARRSLGQIERWWDEKLGALKASLEP
ncbi:MAG TPA: metalloregulator ArsR/SmtB family transcription factor [Dehalococcoidia bacterium]|nr:metalloregulator ArsR/SmtB family transcription factor [Dehalococcoidia bacterium]